MLVLFDEGQPSSLGSMAPGTTRFLDSEGFVRCCSLLLSSLAAAISALALINILKLCLNSTGIVLGKGRSSSRVRSDVCGGTGFLILSVIEPRLRSMIYCDVSVLDGSSCSSGSWDPRTLAVAWGAFVAGSECSYEIVTRTKLDTTMTRSSSNTCNLLGRYAVTDIRSGRVNRDSVLHSPTKSSISDGPFAAPKRA